VIKIGTFLGAQHYPLSQYPLSPPPNDSRFPLDSAEYGVSDSDPSISYTLYTTIHRIVYCRKPSDFMTIHRLINYTVSPIGNPNPIYPFQQVPHRGFR
jgi:hypothetical protein